MPEADPGAERLLSGAVAIAASATTLQGSLDGLASLLSSRYPVARVSVRTYDAETESIVVDGVWSVRRTEVPAGTRLPARSTSFDEVDRRGGAVLSRWSHDTDGVPLLDRILFDEGLRSWVVVPLRRDVTIEGLFTVAVDDADGLTEADLPLFEGIGQAIGERVLALARARV